MEETELKKDFSMSQTLGILAIIGLTILIGGVIVASYGIYFEVFIEHDIQVVTSSGKSALIPDWTNTLGIIVAIVVLIVIGLLAFIHFRKRE